jgi:5-methylcytosine-specific restriction endonuclease McrA
MRKDTKARDFDRKTKEAIAKRDSIDGWPCCVFCGAPAPSHGYEILPISWSNAHYISRAQGGLGDERNGLTLCPKCHRKYDQSTSREEMRGYFREYLKDHYDEWREEDLIYRKETYGR